MVPRLKVVNAQGEVIYKGRQLGETKAQTPKLATKASRSLLEEAHRLWEHDSLKSWDFDEPPEKLIVGHQDKHPIYLYPGLYRQDSTISLKLFAQKAQALSSTQSAWPHFCALGFDRELGWWQRDFQHSKKLGRGKNALSSVWWAQAVFRKRLSVLDILLVRHPFLPSFAA